MTIVLVWKPVGQSPTPSEFFLDGVPRPQVHFETMEALIERLKEPWPQGQKPWAHVGTGIMPPHTLGGFIGLGRNPIRSWS